MDEPRLRKGGPDEAGPRPPRAMLDEDVAMLRRHPAFEEGAEPPLQPGRGVLRAEISKRRRDDRSHLPVENLPRLGRRDPETAQLGELPPVAEGSHLRIARWRQPMEPVVPRSLEVEQIQLVVEIGDEADLTMPADDLNDRGRAAPARPEDDDQHQKDALSAMRSRVPEHRRPERRRVCRTADKERRPAETISSERPEGGQGSRARRLSRS